MFDFSEKDHKDKTIIDYIIENQKDGLTEESKKFIRLIFHLSDENFKNYLLLNYYDLILSLN